MRRLLCAALLLAAGRAGAEPACADRAGKAAGTPIAVDAAVEPNVCEALVTAIGRMPSAHRALLAGLKVVRAHDLGVPTDAPLITRMFSAGALAYYQIGKHALVITDAGAAGKPGWTSGPVTAADVEPLLDDLGLKDKGIAAGWADLAKRAGLATPPPVGDPAVIDALVKLAVGKLLGGEVPLDALITHELGHLIQLHPPANSMAISGWATLSGWRETQHDEPADGYVGGFFHNEEPIVALRLSLGLDRGKKALYEPRAGGFVTDYGRFDPMEDYGETYRLLLTKPEALAAVPEKWVAAAGFLTGKAPPSVPAATLDAGARRLLGDSEGPPVDAGFAVQVLRPHAPALAGLARALGRKPPRLPDDLDPDVERALKSLSFKAGGGWIVPSDASFQAAAAELISTVEDLREFNAGLPALDDGKKPVAKKPRRPYDRAVAADVEARRRLAAGDLAGARGIADKIAGPSSGAFLKARLLVALCKAYRKAGDSAQADAAAAAARGASDGILYPDLRKQVPSCPP